MKKIILSILMIFSIAYSENARCEYMLQEIEDSTDKLTIYYQINDKEKIDQILKDNFKIATEALDVCEDEKNIYKLESILTIIGVQLGM